MLSCTGPYTKEKIYNTFIKCSSLYETIITPVVTCGAEPWTLTNKMERVLMTEERKILRKVYGQTYENGYWRKKLMKKFVMNLNLQIL